MAEIEEIAQSVFDTPTLKQFSPTSFTPADSDALLVVANDFPALELKPLKSSFGATSFILDNNPVANVRITASMILKQAGTGDWIRLAGKAKQVATGGDTSAPFTVTNFIPVDVSGVTVGEEFEATVELDYTSLIQGQLILFHIGRDGNNELGAGQNDTFNRAIQMIAIDIEVPQ